MYVCMSAKWYVQMYSWYVCACTFCIYWATSIDVFVCVYIYMYVRVHVSIGSIMHMNVHWRLKWTLFCFAHDKKAEAYVYIYML